MPRPVYHRRISRRDGTKPSFTERILFNAMDKSRPEEVKIGLYMDGALRYTMEVFHRDKECTRGEDCVRRREVVYG